MSKYFNISNIKDIFGEEEQIPIHKSILKHQNSYFNSSFFIHQNETEVFSFIFKNLEISSLNNFDDISI